MKRFIIEKIYRRNRVLYLIRIILTPKTPWGQLYLHIFITGDEDPDPHNHPWDFWTLPFRSYREEVYNGLYVDPVRVDTLPAFQWQFREAGHIHRVIGPVRGKFPFLTLVWHKPKSREWGFWKVDPKTGRRTVFEHWKSYNSKGKKT